MKYINLGLPSGTLWAEGNEEGYYIFDKAIEKYGNNLPTREQLYELKTQCKWEWEKGRYKVTGPNGNYIILPAMGFRYCDGRVNDVGSLGGYWSSSPCDLDCAWCLDFLSRGVRVYNYRCYHGFSVRLVKQR